MHITYAMNYNLIGHLVSRRSLKCTHQSQNMLKDGHSPVIVDIGFAGRLSVLSNDHLPSPAWR